MHSCCKLSINYVGGAQRTGGSIQLDSDQFPLSALYSVMADPYLHFTFDTSISGLLITAFTCNFESGLYFQNDLLL